MLLQSHLRSEALPPPKRFLAYQSAMFLSFTALFWQDRQMCLKRQEAIERLHTGKIEFMDMSSLAPRIPSRELDQATGQNGEETAELLMTQAISQVNKEEVAERKRNWWKLRS